MLERALARPKQLDRDLDDEVAFHLTMREEKNRAAGMDAAEARLRGAAAIRKHHAVKENSRICGDGFRSKRFGKTCATAPGRCGTALASRRRGAHAGFGYRCADGDLQRDRFRPAAAVAVHRTRPTRAPVLHQEGVPIGAPSPLDVRDFARGNHTFANMVVYDHWRKNVNLATSFSEPEQRVVGLVPAAYFQTLDIRPVMGRLFTEEENHYGKHYVAAISARLWRNRFASDRSILGRKIRINDESYAIVAVMPDAIPDWLESRTIDVWTPFAPTGNEWFESSRGERDNTAIGRLKPGVSIEQAQADLATIAAGLAATHPIDRGVGVILKPLADTRIGTLRPVLFLLMGAVSLVLLIACANLANLLLARNSVRQRELAVRVALGAGRVGLVRQLLAETLLLSLIGGAAGLLLARLGLVALTRTHVNDLPQLAEIGIHFRSLLFALLTSLFDDLLFGLAPALAGTRLNLADALKEGGRSGSMGSRKLRFRNALVAAEMALSLILVVGASLLVQSIVRLQRQDVGARVDHLLKGHFYVPPARYPDAAAITRFWDQLGQTSSSPTWRDRRECDHALPSGKRLDTVH